MPVNLSKPTPCYSSMNGPNSPTRDAKRHRNRMLRLAFCDSFPSFKNLLTRKFRASIMLAIRSSILTRGIVHIVFLCSKKQMLGIYTSWIVASRAIVKHVETLWNWSFANLPRKTMRQYFFHSTAHDPITKRGFFPRPQPTRISLIDTIFKLITNSVCCRDSHGSSTALFGTIVFLHNAAWPDMKNTLAYWACKIRHGITVPIAN